MVKSMVKNHANLSFQILPEFFSSKSFMQWAPGEQFCGVVIIIIIIIIINGYLITLFTCIRALT